MRLVKRVSKMTRGRVTELRGADIVLLYPPIAILYKLKLGEIVTTIPTIGE